MSRHLVDRLTKAAVVGGLKQRSWSLLITAAFLALATAGAAAPMFAEASADAAFQVRRDEVPDTARQTDAAVVRMSADVGPSSLDQGEVLAAMRRIPGLTTPDLSGGSVGAELAAPDFWRSALTHDGKTERARLFAVTDPAQELVVTTAARDGVWLPAPVATALDAEPGDQLTLTLGKGKPKQTPVTFAGAYAVGPDGRLPADPDGSRRWAVRAGDTPGDTEYRTLPAYLIIGDVATIERLATAVGDRLLWSVEAALVPDATLGDAKRTAAGIEALRRDFATRLPSEGNDPLALRYASGIGRIVATAEETAATVRQRTRPVEWAAIGVGFASVLAVAVLTARRRERELRHAVSVGISPLRVGGLWLLEHLAPAVIGAVLGWVAAWQLVARLGPPGTLRASLPEGALTASATALGGLLLVAAVGAAATARRVRPTSPATVRRSLPWPAMLVVVALVAAAGLTGGAGDTRGLDLLVPLLVLAALGVVAGWIPALLVGRKGRGRGALWLARRRLGGGGTERRLAIMVVTAGLGMLLFGISAVHSNEVSAGDRVAVAAGAEGVATLQGSWELKDTPLPPTDTVVWRIDVTTPVDEGQRDVLAVDPARFADVALWGDGPDLAEARDAVRLLTAGNTIVVGDPALADLAVARVSIGFTAIDLDVAARVAAFPGMRDRPMYVVAADPLFDKLNQETRGEEDPREPPRNGFSPSAPLIHTFLWSSAGSEGIQRTITPRGIQPEVVRDADELRRTSANIADERARGYQLAIAGYLALLAVLTLCVYAQRTAALRRPADLMLARVGLGRARVSRARHLEYALLAATALIGAVAGVAALTPIAARLLDDQPGLLPRYAFALSLPGLAITAAAAALAVLLAVPITATRPAATEEDAYRDD